MKKKSTIDTREITTIGDVIPAMKVLGKKQAVFHSTVGAILGTNPEDIIAAEAIEDEEVLACIDFEIPEQQRKARKVTKADDTKNLRNILEHSLFNAQLVVVIYKGKPYLVDGGHRWRFLNRVKNNEVKIDRNGMIRTFDSLDDKDKNTFNDIEISVLVFTDVSINEGFLYFNGGNPVNRMEKLHSEYCENPVWKISEEFVNSLSVTHVLSEDNACYKNNNSVLQCLGLVSEYESFVANGYVDAPTTKGRALLMAFNENKKYATASNTLKRLRFVFDMLAAKTCTVIEEIETAVSIDLVKSRSHKRQIFVSCAYAFYRMAAEMSGDDISIKTFRKHCEKVFKSENFAAKLRDELIRMEYKKYFSNGKDINQPVKLYEAIATVIR